jgi:hypothetical protein
MSEVPDRRLRAGLLPDWSLVRLADGSVGVLTKRGETGRVTLPGQTGVDLTLDTEVELVKHPAEMAAEALARHYETRE